MRCESRLSVIVLLCAPLALAQITPSPWWKNEITFPREPFCMAGTSSDDPGWVKFAILLPPYDPGEVYFQDCRQYPFHYDFAVNHLDPFLGMTRAEFDAVSLYAAGQQVVMGAVILPPTAGWPPPPAYPEYGIELVRRDAYTPEQVQAYFNAVRAAVQAAPGVKAYYFPSYEQIVTAEANRDWFASQGIELGSAARWAEGNVSYSTGWALGTLKFFPADEIDRAFLLGELTSGDILLTDGIPAEIPLVAGVLTSAPATPNSHVAILAQTFGIPFAYLKLAEDLNKAQSLIGRDVVLRVYETWEGTDVRLIDTTGQLDETTKAEILALKRPGDLAIPAITPYGAWSANTDGLMPSDIRYFGGKAANYGLLRTSIPDNCPRAAAFSFDLWNAFLDQTIYTGRTLREEIALRLAGFTWPPADMAALSNALDNVQALFTQPSVTSFSPELQAAVLATLEDPQYAFDPNRNIRFRSSTNVEDSEQFTGAGLYDSYSGCLADDLDSDGTGPCRCDPVENNERGVFRAIRKVFASFYNDNAYLERLRWGVDESQVGMGLLVHHSFPDETELANGVATLAKTTAGSKSRSITLVTQLGAVSVSNPTDGSIPEEVSVNVYYDNHYPNVLRESNLVPRGSTVMTWQQDYIDLAKLLVAAGNRFETATGKATYLLDFEYKKDAPTGDLVVKQIRQLPQPDTAPTITPFLLNEPADYVVFQGETGEVFASHRLKSLWRMQTRNTWLREKDLTASIFSNVVLDYLHGCDVRLRHAGFESWPEYGYNFANHGSVDSWMFDDLRNGRRYDLSTSYLGVQVSQAASPILTLRDFGKLGIDVWYDEPVPTSYWLAPGTTVTDYGTLWPRPVPRSGDLLQTRTFVDAKQGITVTTSFYFPPPPKGIVAGYTAPLARWDKTTIEGLTSEPIVLHGDYSQTYKPEHHNFGEQFIFEPRLEEGISPALLNELRLKNVCLVLLHLANEAGTVTIYGFDKGLSPTDLDGDGNVDATDLGLFGRFWHETACGRCGGADQNGDGNVGTTDLAAFAEQWLTTYY